MPKVKKWLKNIGELLTMHYHYFIEKSITTCKLCLSAVGSALSQIESTVEGFIVGIIEGAINGFVEDAKVYNPRFFTIFFE